MFNAEKSYGNGHGGRGGRTRPRVRFDALPRRTPVRPASFNENHLSSAASLLSDTFHPFAVPSSLPSDGMEEGQGEVRALQCFNILPSYLTQHAIRATDAFTKRTHFGKFATPYLSMTNKNCGDILARKTNPF